MTSPRPKKPTPPVTLDQLRREEADRAYERRLAREGLEAVNQMLDVLTKRLRRKG